MTAQLRGIIGIEVPITRIEGKWKVSQNRPVHDRAGVVAGLRGSGDDGETDRVVGRSVAGADPRSPDRKIVPSRGRRDASGTTSTTIARSCADAGNRNTL